MGQRLVRKDGEHHRHSDAVVPAEGGFVRPDIRAVGDKVDRLARHILGAVGGLGADHVQMALKNDRRRMLAAGRAVLPDDDVVCGVLPVPQPMRAGKFGAEVAGRAGVAATVRYRAELFKIRKYVFRLQFG